MAHEQRIEQVTPELWATQSRWLHYNSGLFISGGEACLIDPGMEPGEIDGLRRFLKAQGAKPTTILLTHWHWDHVLGPGHFPAVKVIAHPLYVDEVERNRDGILAEVSQWEREAGVRREADFAIPLPDETVEDGAALMVGGLTVRLIHVPGHSPDQLALYHAERRALWASDIMSDLEIPFVSDSLAAYENTLAGLAELDLQALVPGHGAATSDAGEIRLRLERGQEYLGALRGCVGAAVRRGLSVEETVRLCAAIDFHGPGVNEAYHRLNVESAYIELGGQADPRKVGWHKDWSEAPAEGGQ